MKFSTFPREIGPPRRIVRNMKDYLAYINMNNGKKNAIYTTLYKFDLIKERSSKPHPEYMTAVVDKLFFDFDDKECDAYLQAKKLHEYCKKENIQHSIAMSGRGYHGYIYTTGCDLRFKKDAIRGGQMFFINKLGLEFDAQVIGDYSRFTRVPNTFNAKANLFCIPLTEEQFNKSNDYIRKLAVKQNFVKDVFMNKNLFDLSPYDKINESQFEIIAPNIQSSNIVNIGEVPRCIYLIMQKENPNYKERYLEILYFKEKGYSKEEVFKILKSHLSEKKLYHCVKDERQLQYLFNRDDLIFPSCEKIKSEGYDCDSCNTVGNSIYK